MSIAASLLVSLRVLLGGRLVQSSSGNWKAEKFTDGFHISCDGSNGQKMSISDTSAMFESHQNICSTLRQCSEVVKTSSEISLNSRNIFGKCGNLMPLTYEKVAGIPFVPTPPPLPCAKKLSYPLILMNSTPTRREGEGINHRWSN